MHCILLLNLPTSLGGSWSREQNQAWTTFTQLLGLPTGGEDHVVIKVQVQVQSSTCIGSSDWVQPKTRTVGSLCVKRSFDVKNC